MRGFRQTRRGYRDGGERHGQFCRTEIERLLDARRTERKGVHFPKTDIRLMREQLYQFFGSFSEDAAKFRVGDSLRDIGEEQYDTAFISLDGAVSRPYEGGGD